MVFGEAGLSGEIRAGIWQARACAEAKNWDLGTVVLL